MTVVYNKCDDKGETLNWAKFMVIDESKRADIKSAIKNKLDLYSDEKMNRSLAYSTRLAFYSGQITPEVGTGHELLVSNLCSSIADKQSAYIGTNPFDVNITPWDITSDADMTLAQSAEDAVLEVLENSDKDLWFLDANENGSRLGDAFIATIIENGVPTHENIEKPENVTIGWATDNAKRIEWWAYDYGISPAAAKEQFKKTLSPQNFNSISGNVSANDREPKTLYGFLSNLPLLSKLTDPLNNKFVKVTDFHTFVDIKDDDGNILIKKFSNVILANDEPFEIIEGKAKGLYHFKGNTYPGLPTGVCDFETACEMIVKLDEALSVEADMVKQAGYHKILTNVGNVVNQKRKFIPGKTQIIQLPDADSFVKVLDLNSQSYNSEPLIKNIVSIVRTLSGLQELMQDQIAPNISGKALQAVMQGVLQVVSKKRKRWEKIIKDLCVDDLAILADGDPEMKKAWFDKDGKFRFKIKVNWPDVLDSDMATKIANVVNERSGTIPLISEYTARQQIGVSDPIMEEKRVDKEMAKRVQIQQQLSGSMVAPSSPEGPMLTEDQNQPGIGSAPGQAGTAQTSGMSAESANAMNTNNSGGI